MNKINNNNAFDTTLKNYAKLLVQSGGNVQKGQLVVIGCDIEVAYFARLVQETAYDAGASEVIINWRDSISARTKYLMANDEIFNDFPDWTVERYKYWDDRGAVYLHIRSEDPSYLSGVDPDRLRRFNKASSAKTKEHSALTMSYKRRWSLCAVPSTAWAKRVFPDLSEDKAVESLWEHILKASRADGDDPVADWQKHRESFVSRVNYLNEQQFSSLRFITNLGTDITIGLPNNHIWKGGGGVCAESIPFFANIPTEEIFTAPDKNRADGRVVASMPLAYMGNLIEGIDITFKDGQVVDFKASKNQDALANIIGMDEGSKRLGEVALVPKSSPINQMGTLFYNTLYDENASCHLALGKGYPSNIEGGTDLSEEELTDRGVNQSLVHVDFMFGTEDMRVMGIYGDGREVVIFESGEYVG